LAAVTLAVGSLRLLIVVKYQMRMLGMKMSYPKVLGQDKLTSPLKAIALSLTPVRTHAKRKRKKKRKTNL
jgi:hypothetical protein